MLLGAFSLVVLPGIVGALSAPPLDAAESCLKFHHFAELTSAPWRGAEERTGFKPWSYEPYCIGPTWDLPNNPDKVFCVYTSRSFRNGRGISLFTTPDAANSVATSRAFTDPESLSEFSPEDDVLPYDMVEKPGRGYGLFANRLIKIGETILIDQPTFVVHRSAYIRFSEEHQEILQWRAMLQLPEEGRNATRGLAKSGRGDEIIDILQTNGFARSYFDTQHVQLVPEGARINHDCRPNSYYRFDTDTMTHYVWALKDIQPGEEITTSYIRDAEASSHTRKKALRETWGFDCTCSICGASTDVVSHSDQRLASIRYLKTRLEVSMSGQKLNMTQGYEHLLNLYDEEGLIYPKIELFEQRAYAYGRLGMEDKALQFAKVARDWWLWAAGREAAETKRVEAFLKEPSKHEKWGIDVVDMEESADA